MRNDTENTFTIIYKEDNAAEWPDRVVKLVQLVEGPLADRIRRAANQPDRSPVVISEVQTDGGYSEYTQETDYDFTLRVGNAVIELGESAYNSVDALSRWLKSNEE